MGEDVWLVSLSDKTSSGSRFECLADFASMSVCGKCQKPCNRQAKDNTSCAICKLLFHNSCVGISIKNSYIKNWTCGECIALRNKKSIARSCSVDASPNMGRGERVRKTSTPTPVSSACFVNNLSASASDVDEVSMSAIKELFSQTNARLTAGLQKLETDLGESINLCHSKIDEFMELLKAQKCLIEQQGKVIEEQHSQIVKLNKRVSELEVRTENQEQYSRANSLEIYGVPETKNEDPVRIVVEICRKLGVQINETAIDACHRLGKQTNRTSAGIIVKFVRRLDKESILTKKRVFRNLSTSQIGGPGQYLGMVQR
nr:PREDICTED: uncharacterized protein LOC109041391 [Bemisia tabaci]